MSKPLFLVVFLVLFLLDLYAFQSIKLLTKNSKILFYTYWGIHFLFYLFLLYAILTFSRSVEYTFKIQFAVASFVILYVPKLFLIIPLLLEDIYRLFSYSIGLISNNHNVQGRRKFVSIFGLALASIPFAGIIHGILKGKYNYKLIKQKLSFQDLPSNFNGFKIIQVSDFHVGSFDNNEKIIQTIDFINQQKADLIVFTGDFVNLVAEEMIPYVDIFSKLNSPNGVISILGNHDYGLYAYEKDDISSLNKNKELLIKINKDLNYDLLLNENRKIKIGDQSINIIGVENWGKPPFPKKGDLNKATSGINDGEFNILLSHDPSHFDGEIKNYHKMMHLTLAGHTHGMQFGIEIPGFRFSPVQFVYPKWAGLYSENNRYLYVNRGFGYNAFPGRVGIWPEITLFELAKS